MPLIRSTPASSSAASGPGSVVILGGGPCGLACADELTRLGHDDWVLLEAAAACGGLASSVTDPAGFTWDLGGHVVFSHFGEFDRLLAELFTPGELLHHDRSSFIRFRDRWVPYPFQQHLHPLPEPDAHACLRDLLDATCRPPSLSPSADFATWLDATYGAALVDRFFAPYNTKVWATPLQDMASGWVAERVAPIDPDEVLAAFSGTTRPEGRWGPNATFAFPARGGTGAIWQRLASRLGGRVRTGARVQAIDEATRRVVLGDGRRIGYRHLVATTPLDQLTAMTTGAPTRVRAAARRLRHTTVAMVGLGFASPTTDERSWLYFPQPDVPFYRATNFSKYAPANVPGAATDRFSGWMTETALRPGTQIDVAELIRCCERGLRGCGLVPDGAEAVSAHVEMIPYAYPVPTVERDTVLAQVVPWLEERGIFPRGRFGSWRYEIGNMDHAVKMGIDIARRLVTGAPEELTALPAVSAPAAKAAGL
ncbi:protoporphyrinogen/coproporphyrinogen oxidase [Streptomyces aidingensis]|uniref:Protoporphyrinogen oxidase n=1 Tax=Streptomyces aidingensis TaxID=910347 RepID=A0A1I1P284_9ACTN|nr:FAD-dependent oxidoreductase [Streptomyces aidingensis]SFD01828.1 Protoporphyrinogen oxidase [Streptomyces aidingensis]